MCKVANVSLSLFLALSLIACSSNTDNKESETSVIETPVATETPKEPELKNISLTIDNWDTYFDLYYEPVIAIASAKDYVKEDEIGKEFYDSYCMVIKLKD